MSIAVHIRWNINIFEEIHGSILKKKIKEKTCRAQNPALVGRLPHTLFWSKPKRTLTFVNRIDGFVDWVDWFRNHGDYWFHRDMLHWDHWSHVNWNDGLHWHVLNLSHWYDGDGDDGLVDGLVDGLLGGISIPAGEGLCDSHTTHHQAN